MAEIKHPVVGDIVYSNGKNPFNVTRTNVTCEKYRIYTSDYKPKTKNRSTFAKVF